ncbi:MAG: hypothetical protein II961_08875 [Candidatus Riflebacteria bacterium]|nr:hypothetical protein [Candidatus Riflebacteria bacterium]
MNNKKSRLYTVITGFFVFAIPLIFLCYSADREIALALDRIEENLQEKVLSIAKKVNENLIPYNYVKEEFNKTHRNLFPELPNEIAIGIPDNSEMGKLYNKDLLNKLLNITQGKNYNPIAIFVGTQDLKEIYTYYCPKLEQSLRDNNDEKSFREAKSYFEMTVIRGKHLSSFNTHLNSDKLNLFHDLNEYLEKNKLRFHYYLDPCYKYISRFKSYNRNESPIYTDYYEKQALYPIIKSTFSKNRIHGFYSILIPQKDVDPEQILKTAISNTEPDVEIVMDKDFKESKIIKNTTSIDYAIYYPTIFLNQIEAYKRLRNIDKTHLLDKQIKIRIKFPSNYNNLKLLNKWLKIIIAISILLFIILSVEYINNYLVFKIRLTQKLIFILSLIIFLPITGIGLLTLTITHNLNDLIDMNVRKNLHISLENYYLLKEEIFTRRLSSIFETKKIISNNDFSDFLKTFNEKIIQDKKNNRWFINFTSSLWVTSDKGKYYSFDLQWDPFGKDKLVIANNTSSKSDELLFKMTEYIMKRYLSNLGLLKKTSKDNTEIFALSMVEKYNNSKNEEIALGQESIPNKNPFGIQNFDSSTYFLAKDKNNNIFYLLSRLNGHSDKQYRILTQFSETNPFWSKPQYKFAYDSNLAISIISTISSKDSSRIQIPTSSINENINNLIYKVSAYQDSGYEKLTEGKETTLNEWIFSDNSHFLITGSAKSMHNTKLSLITSLIFPILFAYATILLILLSDLISQFINKPISIFNEGIKNLNDNNIGYTIESFSNDEFNYITNAFNEMSIALKQKEQIKRFVSDKLAQSVENNALQETLNGTQEKVTVLSSDIRNFTGISEKYEPSVIVEMLNSYFTKMQQEITANRGIIDKYIGDAIQAVFYDEPNQKEGKVIRAAKAALAMRKALAELNIERRSKGLFTIENGIGIDTDFAISGTIGTSKGRKDFSVNGEVIERAANLEAKTKQTESKILISKASLEEINENKDCLNYKVFDEEAVELIDVRE